MKTQMPAPAALVVPDGMAGQYDYDTLAALAGEIREHEQQAQATFRTALEHGDEVPF